MFKILDERGHHLDRRSGEKFDLFFPGYFKNSRSLPSRFRSAFLSTGTQTLGENFAADWAFDERGFEELAQFLEGQSNSRWSYGHDSELVLFHVQNQALSAPEIDWTPLSGRLSETGTGSLQWIVSQMGEDFEKQNQDSYYGIGDLVSKNVTQTGGDVLSTLGMGAASSLLATLGIEAAKIAGIG